MERERDEKIKACLVMYAPRGTVPAEQATTREASIVSEKKKKKKRPRTLTCSGTLPQTYALLENYFENIRKSTRNNNVLSLVTVPEISQAAGGGGGVRKDSAIKAKLT